MRTNIPALTSLRFFAAAAIFALHAEQIAGFPKGSFAGFSLTESVALFYALSGFILHYNYRNNISAIGWLKFLTLRFFRLWPLHVVGLFLAAILAWDDISSWYRAYLSIPDLAAIIFMMQAWSTKNEVVFAINGVSWSMSVELFFYAIFPIISHWFRKKPVSALAITSIPPAALVIFAQLSGIDTSSGIYNTNPLTLLPEFTIGVFFAELYVRQHTAGGSRITWTVIEFSTIAALAISNWIAPTVFAWILAHQGIAAVAYVKCFYSAIMCSMVIYAISVERGYLSSALRAYPIRVLGEASFALYVIHQPTQKFMAERFDAISPGALAAVCSILTILIAIILHRTIEIPAYRFTKKLLYAGPTKQPGRNHSAGCGTSALTESGRES
ncbi:MAG: acyltransferase [Burkholderia sp.]